MSAASVGRVSGLLCCAAVLAVGLAGCGGSDSPKKASASMSASASASASASSTPSGSASADPKLASIRQSVQQQGTGTFTQSDEKVDGTQVSRAQGSYSLKDETVSATVTIPDTTTKKVATARVRLVDGKAYLQVDQWKQPSRSCWLASTASDLSSSYALDVSSGGSTPLAVALLDEFKVTGNSGPGTFQGSIPIASVLPLLSGSLKEQLEQANPKGTAPAFLVADGKTITFTVPGYGLVPELAAALGVDTSQFSSIQNDRYFATVTPGASSDTVVAPAKSKQMTDQQLAKNSCG
ncbi:hypothetical protein [Nocardioides mangrovicus]|uniref:hypothetical protein n=1 Tax=Nocardioides mangrovicus TaxID=2478913 RepID=UPI0018E072BC|nr:hypothetical protein [Nocardioides mangrovicus]